MIANVGSFFRFAGNLYIHNVDPHDAGTYICRSNNDMNQANTMLTEVEVLGLLYNTQ